MITNAEESQRIKDIGEELQLEVYEELLDILEAICPELIEYISSAPMSANGEDIQISSMELRELIPYSIDCKVRAKGLSEVYRCHEEAMAINNKNGIEGTYPLTIFQQPDRVKLAVTCWDDYKELLHKHLQLKIAYKELKANALPSTN